MDSKETTLSINFTDGNAVVFSGDACISLFNTVKDGCSKNEIIYINVTQDGVEYLFNPINITALEMRHAKRDK